MCQYVKLVDENYTLRYILVESSHTYRLVPYKESDFRDLDLDSIPVYMSSKLGSMESLRKHIYSNRQLRKKLDAFEMYEPRFSFESLDQAPILEIEFRSRRYFSDYNYDESGYEDAEFIWESAVISDFIREYPNVPSNYLYAEGGDKLHVYLSIQCPGYALQRIK